MAHRSRGKQRRRHGGSGGASGAGRVERQSPAEASALQVAASMVEYLVETDRDCQAERLKAREEFLGARFGQALHLDLDEEALSDAVFAWWFAVDRPLACDGASPIARLARVGREAAIGPWRVIREFAGSVARVYEVTDVAPGHCIGLRSLHDGQHIRAVDEVASTAARPRQLLLARVLRLGSPERNELHGGFLVLPRWTRPAVLAAMGAAEPRDGVESHQPGVAFVPAIHRIWLESRLARRPPPEADPWALLASTLASEPARVAPGGTAGLAAAEPDSSIVAGGAGPAAVPPRGESPRRQAGASAVDPAERSDPAAREELLRRWIDHGQAGLGGRSPREAAGVASLRGSVTDVLCDLELAYCQDLERGSTAYDPTWLWAELGLRDHDDAPGIRPGEVPRLGHDLLCDHVEGLRETVASVAARFRRRFGDDPRALPSREDLERDAGCERFVIGRARRHFREWRDPDHAVLTGNISASYLECLVCFDLHRRKVLWVDEPLSWMLGHTDLDVAGEQLRMPFAAFCVAFTDRYALGLAERAIAVDADADCRGRVLQSVVAHVRETQEGDQWGIRVTLLSATSSHAWPHMLVRDLVIARDARLDEILASRFADIDESRVAPVFRSQELQDLLGLVLNAILYATSASVELDDLAVRRDPQRWARQRGTLGGPDDVYFLPGKIDIRQLRGLQGEHRVRASSGPTHRFLVRGHWRRPARQYHDQRTRWIEPYWKGPDAAAVIEREYRLRAPVDAAGGREREGH